MTEYALYVESGPQHKKTMVHVLDLLGCIAQGPTTDAALAATPDAIREFLRFLRRHKDAVDPKAPFNIEVAAHVMEGSWLGQGNPMPGFAPDFEPLSARDLETYLKRLDWLHADFLRLLRGISPAQRAKKPAHGRPIAQIVAHMSEAYGAYVRGTVGPVDGLADALRAVRELPGDPAAALADVWDISSARLATMTADERNRQVPHGQQVWTARRGLRRMLEHDWEHMQEVRARVGGK